MTTRPRSSDRRVVAGALGVLVALVVAARPAPAQTDAASEAALRQRYDVAHWRAGTLRAGVAIDALAVPGLPLRARTDRPARQGGITLGFGAQQTTLVVRVAVGLSVSEGKDSLVGLLRGAQRDQVPLSDGGGADVALGDSARGDEEVTALFGNVAFSVRRTREAGADTPPARAVLALLVSALGPATAPATPRLSLASVAAAVGGPSRVHVDLRGTAFAHVEATVAGGHLRGRPSPAGLDVVADGPGPVDVRVVATDALGRTAVGALTLPAASPAP